MEFDDLNESFVENKKNNYTLEKFKEPGILQTPILLALFACFCGFSVQAGLETFVTVFTNWYMGWTMKENSFVFVLSGFSATSSYILITVFTARKWLSDRQLLLIGLVANFVLAHLAIGIISSMATFRASWLQSTTLIGIFFVCVG